MKEELANLLNPEQKAAILTVLKWIGLWVSLDVNGSGDMLPKATAKLKADAGLLKLGLSSNLLKIYENDDAEEQLFDTLNTLPVIVKTWFVVETYMMVSIEGDITQRAMHVTLSYCEKLGISEAMYLDIIKQAYILSGDFEEGLFDI